jgi:hypothetical protein
MDSWELSSWNASCAGFRGATLRLESRASRASKSARRLSSVVEIPLEINCLWRLSALCAALAVKNTFKGAWGKMTVPISRPSAKRPGRRWKLCCRATKAVRTWGKTETLEAFMPASSVRMASLTSCVPQPHGLTFKTHRQSAGEVGDGVFVGGV